MILLTGREKPAVFRQRVKTKTLESGDGIEQNEPGGDEQHEGTQRVEPARDGEREDGQAGRRRELKG